MTLHLDSWCVKGTSLLMPAPLSSAVMERVLEPEVMDTREEAEAYDAMDHSAPNAAFVERLLALGVHGRVLDIGCGPGHIPLQLAAVAPEVEVVGVDLSREMLRIAEEHRAVSPDADRVSFRLADAKGLEDEANSFDSVCSNTILHHIPEPVPFLAEAWRVLRPGGVLLIRDLFRPDDHVTVARLVARYAGEETAEAQELFRASLCAALTPAELEAAAAAAGMTGIEVSVDSDRHVSLQTGMKATG